MAARSFASDLKVSGTRSRESRFATEAAATTSLDKSNIEEVIVHLHRTSKRLRRERFDSRIG